jgi:hypothetical protein
MMYHLKAPTCAAYVTHTSWVHKHKTNQQLHGWPNALQLCGLAGVSNMQTTAMYAKVLKTNSTYDPSSDRIQPKPEKHVKLQY